MNSRQSDTDNPVRRAGLMEQVASRFGDEISSGRWPVGKRIPTEPELVRIFGVGRNTVREALQSLVHAGLLRRDQGRGTFVISDSELTGSLRRQLAGGSRRDYLELRLALDSTAAALAARRRTDDDVSTLRDLQRQRAASWGTGDPGATSAADLALHRAIVATTHNPLYLQLYVSMLDVFAAHMRDEHDDEAPSADRQHRELVEAIALGDADAAVALVAEIFEPFMS